MNNLRIAAKIYDDLGFYDEADEVDIILREAARGKYNLKPLMYAVPFFMGMNTKTPILPNPLDGSTEQQITQSIYDEGGVPEDITRIPELEAVSTPSKPKTSKPAAKPSVIPANVPKGNFSHTMDLMFNLEGGYSNDKHDPGGATNYGVTHYTFDNYKKKLDLPEDSVKDLSRSSALKIYKTGYWNIIKGSKLPHNVAKALMSLALTDGPQDAIRFVQSYLDMPEVTGVMGPKTLRAIWQECKNGDINFTKALLDEQVRRYKNNQLAKYFGKGWENRVKKVEDALHENKPKKQN